MSHLKRPQMGTAAWDRWVEAHQTTLRKAKERQDAIRALEESQFPTIESHLSAPSRKRKNSVNLEELEDGSETPPPTDADTETRKKRRVRGGYEGWHMQYVPRNLPPDCLSKKQSCICFDSRHFNEYPRPKGWRKKCFQCKAPLGYYRKEVDVYGSGEAYDVGSGTED